MNSRRSLIGVPVWKLCMRSCANAGFQRFGLEGPKAGAGCVCDPEAANTGGTTTVESAKGCQRCKDDAARECGGFGVAAFYKIENVVLSSQSHSLLPFNVGSGRCTKLQPDFATLPSHTRPPVPSSCSYTDYKFVPKECFATSTWEYLQVKIRTTTASKCKPLTSAFDAAVPRGLQGCSMVQNGTFVHKPASSTPCTMPSSETRRSSGQHRPHHCKVCPRTNASEPLPLSVQYKQLAEYGGRAPPAGMEWNWNGCCDAQFPHGLLLLTADEEEASLVDSVFYDLRHMLPPHQAPTPTPVTTRSAITPSSLGTRKHPSSPRPYRTFLFAVSHIGTR
jgi:hypothetical protein